MKHLNMPNAVSVAVSLIIALTIGYLSSLVFELYERKQLILISEIVNSQASAIERKLERSLSSTRILAQEVRQHGGLFPQFEEFAEEVMNTIGGVSNLQLAPDGIIRLIHPLKGNEKAIGHNILKDDARRKEALLAVEEKHMTLAGPFDLIQGGVGIIGRNPVFIKSNGDNSEIFWGFASALIFLDDLINATELLKYEEKGYSFELYRIHPDTGKYTTIVASKMLPSVDGVTGQIMVPNGIWYLRVSDPTSISSYYKWIGVIVGVMLSGLIGHLLRRILLQPSVLRTVVETQTKSLMHLAHHDTLTNLGNRAKFRDAVESTIAGSKRHGGNAYVLVIDLDDFKPINDLFGHEMGDEVLRVISKRLSSCVRETDLVARMGGDEFAILLDQMGSSSEVVVFLNRILEEIKKPIDLHGRLHKLSASVGIAKILADGDDFATLYKHSDLAMYSAKSKGKNNFIFYDAEIQNEAIRDINIQRELQQALDNEEFAMYFQPIFDLSKNEVVYYEALIRWIHPEKGLILPGQFIAAAEKSHIILDLGYWVIDECCRLIMEKGIKTPISLNLSPKQFAHSDLVVSIKNILIRHNTPPSLVEIELTESCFIDNFDRAITVVNDLIEFGISVSLDDFGTGFSSLTLLQLLPVSKLKIDRSFVQSIGSDDRDKHIVSGLISMAQSMNLQVVAEGIETVEQIELIRNMNCNLGQGYYFSRPMSASHFFG